MSDLQSVTIEGPDNQHLIPQSEVSEEFMMGVDRVADSQDRAGHAFRDAGKLVANVVSGDGDRKLQVSINSVDKGEEDPEQEAFDRFANDPAQRTIKFEGDRTQFQ